MKKPPVSFACFFILLTVFPAVWSFGQSAFKQGEELFLRNRPREAVTLLETALTQEPRNEKIYLYLGIAYEQLKNHERAIAVMRRGLDFAIQHKDLLYFNLGNNYYVMGEGAKAAEMYTRAIETNGALSDAYLNRANSNVKLDKLGEAAADYRLFLVMEPDTRQRPEIERMIRLIEGVAAEREAKREEEELRRKEEEERRRIAEEQSRLDAEERQRIAAEQRRREEELRRQEEERRRIADEARQKALLEEVLRSLQASTEGASNLSAEMEDIREKKEDVDIED